MPIYDYICPNCEKQTEILVQNSEAEVICNECRTRLVRLLSSPGLLKTNFHDKPKVKERK